MNSAVWLAYAVVVHRVSWDNDFLRQLGLGDINIVTRKVTLRIRTYHCSFSALAFVGNNSCPHLRHFLVVTLFNKRLGPICPSLDYLRSLLQEWC